ncbi:MAG: 3-isopropylmalate dehydrogenase [Candidatus Altiarchaeales archaeon]|nr:3-isopropylmalate dehydrogenase [Candidatus Altiarchaeales archaeon]
MHKVAVLPGDGIGQEIMPEAVKVLDKLGEFSYVYADVGGAAIDKHGKALPEETLKACRQSDAILFGAVGGPKWEKLPPEQQPERAALLPLRKIFDLYANLRPAKIFKPLAGASPLKPEIIGEGIDILIVRELTSDVYFGQPKGIEGTGDNRRGFDMMQYTAREVKRIAKTAFEAALKRNKKVTSIDKANVLHTMVLWRETVAEVAKKYPQVELNNMYVDNASQQLVKWPHQFDVILAGNMFGDILSDEAAIITGSLGMLPSASLNEKNFGLYEPVHGSAPDIAGQKKANPIAQILSAGMMLKYSFGMQKEAQRVEDAVLKTLEDGYRTGDIMTEGCQKVNTQEMGDLIAERI